MQRQSLNDEYLNTIKLSVIDQSQKWWMNMESRLKSYEPQLVPHLHEIHNIYLPKTTKNIQLPAIDNGTGSTPADISSRDKSRSIIKRPFKNLYSLL